MKINLDVSVLTLTPENDQDKQEILRVFGQPNKPLGSRGTRDFPKSYGQAVYLNEDGISVDIHIERAWWDYDD